jgi:hypothetical protein
MGNRYALHDFKELVNPIAVKVTTDSPSNFITGTGMLKFWWMNSTIIPVKRVYFCEQARSTLLSIGSFKGANAHFHVGREFKTIDLLAQNGKLLLCSRFDPRKNSWPLPQPIWTFNSSPSPHWTFVIAQLICQLKCMLCLNCQISLRAANSHGTLRNCPQTSEFSSSGIASLDIPVCAKSKG